MFIAFSTSRKNEIYIRTEDGKETLVFNDETGSSEEEGTWTVSYLFRGKVLFEPEDNWKKDKFGFGLENDIEISYKNTKEELIHLVEHVASSNPKMQLLQDYIGKKLEEKNIALEHIQSIVCKEDDHTIYENANSSYEDLLKMIPQKEFSQSDKVLAEKYQTNEKVVKLIKAQRHLDRLETDDIRVLTDETYDVKTKKTTKYIDLSSYPEIKEPYNGVDFKIQNDVLIKYLGKDKEVIIPDGIKEIGEEAFAKTFVRHVTIPASVIKISRCAFSHAWLESIVVPDSVQIIEDYAFNGCSYLKEATLPKKLKKLGKDLFASVGAYSPCELEKVNLPEEVEELSNSVLIECKNLKEIVIPSSYTIIPKYMFQGCENLHVTIPSTVRVISQGAFAYCSNGDTELILPQGIEIIDEEAFYCSNLQVVTIPESVRKIGKKAFSDWRKRLRTVNLYSNSFTFTPDLFEESSQALEINLYVHCQLDQTNLLQLPITSFYFETEEILRANLPALRRKKKPKYYLKTTDGYQQVSLSDYSK